MIYLALTSLLAIAALAFLLIRGESQKDAMRAEFDLERQRWVEQETSLLNRIQAPEKAVVDSLIPDAPPVPGLPFDDDDAFQDARA